MRTRSRARAGAIALGAALAALACGTALAYFSTTGTGTVSAGVSNLGKSTISAATPAIGGTVTLTWGAVTAPGTGSVTYYVTRDGGSPSGTCPTSTAPSTVTTCIDKGLDPGQHTYRVVAVWRSWSTVGPPVSANVAIGAATHFDLSAAPTAPTAGTGANLTIAAKDANGATVTTYTGSKSLTFSGASASPAGNAPTVANSSGTAVAFGTATAITFTAGVATVSTTKNGVMKIYRAGAASVSVSDGTISAETPLAVTVAAAAVAKLVLTVESATPAVGVADDLTIAAQDAYGNTATTYTGARSLTFSGASASPGGAIPTVTGLTGEPVAFGAATTIEFTAGVATTSGSLNGEMRLYRSGATSVKVSDGSLTSATVTVTPAAGAAVKFLLAASTVTPVAGASVNLTTTAQDAYGNTATTYTGAKSLTFSGASASPGGNAPTVANSSGTAVAFGTATPITFTAGVATVSSTKNGVMKVYRAGEASISVSDGTIAAAAPVAVTVTAAAISKLVLAVESATPAVGAADDLTVSALDTYSNPILTYTGARSLTFSGASASPGGAIPTVTGLSGEPVAFGAATTIEFTAGVATTSGSLNGEMRLYKSGATSVKVSDGSLTSAAVTVTPPPGAAAKLLLAASTLTPVAGASVNLTTTAQDAYGNTATTYTGARSLTFSGASTSPGGTAPTVVNSAGTAVAFGGETALTFTNGVAAVGSSKNGLMKLTKVEAASIAVSDGTISTPSGLTVTVSPAAAARLAFDEPVASAGSLSASCFFTCTATSLGNSGRIESGIAVTDTYGNPISNLGTGHTVTVTTSPGTITGGTLSIAATGAAESTTRFTFTAPSSGAFTAAIKAATLAGTVYTNATATATK